MNTEYQKKSYALFRAWLAVLAAAVLFFLFGGNSYFPLIGAGKNLGIMMFAFLDLLFVIVLATQSVYWVGGITYEEAAEAGKDARRRYALRNLAVFLAGTVLFLVYCFGMKEILPPDQTRDALVAGGMLCASAVVSSRLRL